jgi:hypothetical protein
MSDLAELLNKGELSLPYVILADAAYKGRGWHLFLPVSVIVPVPVPVPVCRPLHLTSSLPLSISPSRSLYTGLPSIMTPFDGKNLPKGRDSFNFHLSQLRINIECAFGMLTQRWGIFWRPLRCHYKQQTTIISVCMKLHNFCNRSARDTLRASRRHMPIFDDAVTHLQDPDRSLRGSRATRRRAPGLRLGRHGLRPAPEVINVYRHAPRGWQPRRDRHTVNMCKLRDEYVRAFERLEVWRPALQLPAHARRHPLDRSGQEAA